MLAFLALLVVAQLGDEVTPVSVRDFYKEKGRRPVIGTSFQDGDIGLLPYRYDPQSTSSYCQTRVLQVLTDDKVLLSIDIYSAYQPDRRVAVLAMKLSTTVTVMMKGGSTRNLADNENVQFGGWWKVDGTESYESASGKRTVRVLRSFQNDETDAIDADLIKKASDKAAAIVKAAADAKAAEELAKQQAEERKRDGYRRTWTSKDGKFTVDAYFINQGDGEVSLRRVFDGKLISVPAGTLSTADIDQARQMTLKKKAER